MTGVAQTNDPRRSTTSGFIGSNTTHATQITTPPSTSPIQDRRHSIRFRNRVGSDQRRNANSKSLR